MRKGFFFSCLLAGSFIQTSVVLAATVLETRTQNNQNLKKRYYEFDVTSQLVNPDCHEEGFTVPVINGQFPGPTIYATKDDEVEILVRNLVPNHNTSIHFHGIRQIGTPESDGVPGVTQEPILPGESFLHRFKVIDQSGTFFYHAHVGLQDDTVKGAFIVYESDEANPNYAQVNNGDMDFNTEEQEQHHDHRPLQAGPYTYDEDRLLQLGEWWHESLEDRESYYMGPQFQFDRGADSILMNGQTVFQPEKLLRLPEATDLPDRLADVAESLETDQCSGYAMLDVEPNKTYRLRVIGSTTFRTLALAIRDHNMTLIEVDGELTEPYDISYLEVSPGQRYSVLLNTGDFEPGAKFPIATNYMWRQRGRGLTENGFGFIRYVSSWTDSKQREHNDDLIDGECIEKLTKRQRTLEKHRDYDFEDEQICFEGRGDCSNETKSRDIQHTEQSKEQAFQRVDDDNSKSEEGRGRRGDDHNSATPQSGRRGGNDGNSVGGGGGGRGRGPPEKPRKVFIDVPSFPETDRPDWLYHDIKPLTNRDPIVDLEDDVRTIKLVTTYKRQPDNTTRYMINGRISQTMMSNEASYVTQHMPFGKLDIDREQKPQNGSAVVYTGREYNEESDTYPIANGEVVDLVFQNTANVNGGCLLHPWHTHGHSHHVIASGEGDYVHDRDKDIRNFAHPLYRDTTIAYPSDHVNDTNKGCGWTKVRILANNPGYWAVHCHITTHMIQGKMIVLENNPFISY